MSEATAYRYMPYLDVYVCHTGDVYIYTWTQNSICSRRERWCILKHVYVLKEQMRIVDLFCGAGGTSDGAKVAGQTLVGTGTSRRSPRTA